MTTITSAPTGTPTTPPPEHPDAQQLAAFLEGRLDGDVKARVVAHLARCGDCAEVFADAAAFQAEEQSWKGATEAAETAEEGGQAGNVLRFPRSPRFWMVGTLVAAGLILFLVQTPALRWFTSGPSYLLPSDEELPELQLDHRWNNARSTELFVPATMNSRTAFRLGVRVEETYWYSGSDDTDTQERLEQDLLALAKPLDGSVGPLVSKLEEPGRRDSGISDIEAELGTTNAQHLEAFAFGRWTAQAQLRALQEDLSFLRSQESQSHLTRVARIANLDLDILEDLRSGSPSPETWQALRDAIRITLDEGPGDAP